MQFRISPCQPEPFKDCAPFKMFQNLSQNFFLVVFKMAENQFYAVMYSIKNEQYDVIFGTRDLFNISYSRELYLFSKFLHFEEIVRVKMAVCFEMIVSET